MEIKDLLYYNSFGGFSKDGKSYIIKTNEENTPAPWSHVIANENFGTVITANGGGYTWSGNSRENKITTWSNDPITDKASEKIILKNSSKEIINVMPNDTLKDYEIEYGFGFAKFLYSSEKIKTNLLVYVPIDRNEKIYSLEIENLSENDEEYEAVFFADVVLGVSKEYTKKHLVFTLKGTNNVEVKNYYRDIYQDETILLSSSIEETEINIDSNKVVTINSKIKVGPKQKEKVIFKITVSSDNDYASTSEETVNEDMEKINMFWDNTLNKIKIKTPVESMNIIMNGWLNYQTLACRMWARSAFYQAGGAFGFRDQLQDSLAMLYVDAEVTRKQIIFHAMHQFKEGDVLHWWHQEKNNGIRTRYTDDLLWLPYVLCEYIEKENDYSILDEEVPYSYMPVLAENERERYDIATITEDKENIYEHSVKAIEKSFNFGERGLPLIGGGDWNDGMNNINGESVWLGFFLYDVLKKFISICEYKKDFYRIEKFKSIMEQLKSALNENAWDDNWYKRAFFKDGTPLGSKINDECKIDGISQSWAVISGAGDEEKCKIALDSLDNYLVDKENMIIKLLTPSFSKTELEPGYIKAYMPGVRENGGQYTHGAIWSIIANAIMKNKERTVEYFRIINPIEHTRTKEAVLKYKVEPYVVVADVYSSPGMIGRGGWSWYTGSSSWLYIAGLEYILGFKKKGEKLIIEPCIPKEWEYCNIIYKYKNAEYNINIYNSEEKNKENKTVYLDNESIETNEIRLLNDGKHKIDVII